MSRFPLHMETGINHHGYELDGHRIWWDADEAQPWMSLHTLDGDEVAQPVTNPAFHVAPAPAAKRNPLMKAAALAFFAPLLEARS